MHYTKYHFAVFCVFRAVAYFWFVALLSFCRAEGSELSNDMYEEEEGDWYSEGEWHGEAPSGCARYSGSVRTAYRKFIR